MPRKSSDVDAFLAKLSHPRKADVLQLRTWILGANKDLTEHIKWNAPSFCIDGDDRVTFRLAPKNMLQLIFHRGAKVKSTRGFSFDDPSGLVGWKTVDRGVVDFADVDVKSSKTKLVALVRAWVAATA